MYDIVSSFFFLSYFLFFLFSGSQTAVRLTNPHRSHDYINANEIQVLIQ